MLFCCIYLCFPCTSELIFMIQICGPIFLIGCWQLAINFMVHTSTKIGSVGVGVEVLGKLTSTYETIEILQQNER